MKNKHGRQIWFESAEECERGLHAIIGSVSNSKGAECLRSLGIAVAADPAARDFKDESRQLQGVARRLYGIGNMLFEVTGKTTIKAAIAEFHLLKCANEELDRLNGEIAELKREQEQHELDTQIAIAKSEGRWSQQREAAAREVMRVGDATVVGAKNMIKYWGRLGSAPVGDPLTFNGKTYVQLSSHERTQLQDQNTELFTAMREHAKAAGQI